MGEKNLTPLARVLVVLLINFAYLSILLQVAVV